MKLSELLRDVSYDMDFDLAQGDVVVDLVVLARVQRLDDTSTTDSTSGIVQYGIVQAACDELRRDRD